MSNSNEKKAFKMNSKQLSKSVLRGYARHILVLRIGQASVET
jgi:hypothetical protein